MAENSLFAILLRKPWWLSLGLGLLLSLIALAALPAHLRLYGTSAGLPFLVIAAIGLWRQSRLPSRTQVEQQLAAVRAMSWSEFSEQVEQAFQRQGYEVSRLPGPTADFALANRNGRKALVSGKRWKAASNGVEVLRELHAVAEKEEAHEGIFLTAGAVTENAQRFAAGNRIRILEGEQLAQLLLWKKAA